MAVEAWATERLGEEGFVTTKLDAKLRNSSLALALITPPPA